VTAAPRYLSQDCRLTLREGLAEYYAVNPAFSATNGFLGQDERTVRAHDVCHVVFGCTSTSADELVVETWTLFGTYIPLSEYVRMTRQGVVTGVVRKFGPYRLARRFVLTSPRVARCLLACARLKHRWPHFDYDAYWDMPLADIRALFGVRVV
jgi:hypothetical protein